MELELLDEDLLELSVLVVVVSDSHSVSTLTVVSGSLTARLIRFTGSIESSRSCLLFKQCLSGDIAS